MWFFFGLFGFFYSGVVGFLGVSILREKGEMYGIFMIIKIMIMKVIKCFFYYVLLDEVVIKGCLRLKREGIDLIF